jgi:hypothetical protein
MRFLRAASTAALPWSTCTGRCWRLVQPGMIAMPRSRAARNPDARRTPPRGSWRRSRAARTSSAVQPASETSLTAHAIRSLSAGRSHGTRRIVIYNQAYDEARLAHELDRYHCQMTPLMCRAVP